MELNATPEILIVDDMDKSRNILVDYLRKHEPKWHYHTASSEDKALQNLEDQRQAGSRIAVMITDLHMDNDKESGIRLIKRAQQVDPLVMTILYSGYGDLLKESDTAGLGAIDIVVKAKKGEKPASERILEKTRLAL